MFCRGNDIWSLCEYLIQCMCYGRIDLNLDYRPYSVNNQWLTWSLSQSAWSLVIGGAFLYPSYPINHYPSCVICRRAADWWARGGHVQDQGRGRDQVRDHGQDQGRGQDQGVVSALWANSWSSFWRRVETCRLWHLVLMSSRESVHASGSCSWSFLARPEEHSGPGRCVGLVDAPNSSSWLSSLITVREGGSLLCAIFSGDSLFPAGWFSPHWCIIGWNWGKF